MSHARLSGTSQSVNNSPACSCNNSNIKLWGPGGPHTALLPVAKLFNDLNPEQPRIEICYGPESTWRSAATDCGAGLFTAAEQQTAGFLRIYESIIDVPNQNQVVHPITMHSAVLIVNKDNPQNISSVQDLLDKHVGIVVNDGNFHGTLTSGTGVWEDVVGRTRHISDLSAFRSKILRYASGSGDARDALLQEDNGIEVWVSWFDWAVANSDKFAFVALSKELEILRPLEIIVTKNEGHTLVTEFAEFAASSMEADALMELGGWHKDWNKPGIYGDVAAGNNQDSITHADGDHKHSTHRPMPTTFIPIR